MENSSSKSLVLSVVGVAILVVAVLGVSFAFFNYTRTGGKNNLITTGSLSFVFEDGDKINLTNHFPISTGEGVGLTGTDKICTFTVTGKTSGSPISYTVSAVEGDTQSGTRFKNSEVFIYIESTSTKPDDITFTPTEGYGAGKAIGALPLVLGTGSVSSAEEVTRSFTVKMWVDSSVVSVGNTGTYTTGEYSNLYYSMKIKVDAND